MLEVCVGDPLAEVGEDALLVLPGNDGPVVDELELSPKSELVVEDELGGVAVVPLVEDGPVKVYVVSVASILVEEVDVQP